MKITIDDLAKLGVCESGLNWFRKNCGTEIDVMRGAEIALRSSEGRDYLRRAVAEHPSTPVDLLTKLSTDDDPDVRRAVAKHPSTSVDLLTKLSTDEDSGVRWAVAEHPSTPVDLLTKLSTDDDPDVRRAAEFNQESRV